MTENDVKRHEMEYVGFMGIERMPLYTLETKRISLSKAEKEGFDSIAQAAYKPITQEHTLIIADNTVLEPYILYHEFTHILDAEVYARGDKAKYAVSSGYTEYHASQIELLIMLGAKSVKEQLSFSVNKSISTIGGEKTVRQYVDLKQRHAIDLFCRKDFPKDIEQLKTAMGVLFNYWGLRSICYMYCKDFEERTENTAFTNHISVDVFDQMDRLMVGWLSGKLIEICCDGYATMIMTLIEKYDLA